MLAALVCAAQVRAETPSQFPPSQSTEAPANAVLLATAGAPTTGAALDSVIQASLQELGVVRVTVRPGIDLGAVQLALDCVAETPQCLRAVTTQSGVQVLIAPTVQRTSSELLITLLRYDARGEGVVRRVLRRVPGTTVGSQAFDAVPDMLRELFGLPPKPKAPPPTAATPTPAAADTASKTERAEPVPLPEAPMEPAISPPVPVVPLVIAGVGVLTIGAGVVVGLMKQSTEKDYNQQQPQTMAQAQSANAKLDKGKTEATVTNVLLGVGGAAVLFGGIWALIELGQKSRSDYEPLTALRPSFAPTMLGVVFTQRGVGL